MVAETSPRAIATASRDPHDAPRSSRKVGFVTALLIALGMLLAEVAIFHTWVSLAGVVTVPIAGYALGPRAAVWYQPRRTTFAMAATAVVVPAMLIAAYGELTTPAVDAAPPLIVSIVGAFAFGMVFLGVPALVVTGIAAVVWIHACRDRALRQGVE
jgi:hypothetical protein